MTYCSDIGRLPIRVELNQLTEGDFVKILTCANHARVRAFRKTKANLIEQQGEKEFCPLAPTEKLMETEGLTVQFTEDAILEIAKISHLCNTTQENIGARRLRSVIAKVMDDLSFTAPMRRGGTQKIDGDYVRKQVEDILQKDASDLSRFVL